MGVILGLGLMPIGLSAQTRTVTLEEAIALALRAKAPIFVEESVIQEAKPTDVTVERGDSEQLQQWLESLDPEDLGKYKM